MVNIKTFESFNEGENWIKDAIKKPGSLRKSLNKKKGEKISQKEISTEISKLKKKDKDTEKPGLQLNKPDSKKYKRLTLARTLKSMKENVSEPKNYMFFSNLENIKKMIDELSKIDKSEVDNLLSEHDWASDHISVATENIEHVYNFLISLK
jgi:hypothetical protein